MNPENCAVPFAPSLQGANATRTLPLLVGDAIHVLNHQVHQALVGRDQQMLAGLVGKQLDAGAQALAVNLGPGKELGRLTSWVVECMREITEVPLFFSAGILMHREVLHRHGACIVINAVTADHNDLVRALSAATEYGSSLVVLLVRSGRETAGLDGRIQLASEVVDQALLHGLPLARLYLDPVLACRPDPAARHVSRGLPDIGSAVESIALIKQLDSRVKTIVALANGSEKMAREQRSGSRCRMLTLLAEAGVDAVLLNCLDGGVMAAAGAIQGGGTRYCGVGSRMTQIRPTA